MFITIADGDAALSKISLLITLKISIKTRKPWSFAHYK